MYIIADFGSPLNKRLKRAWQRSLFPNDDALSAVQKARGRKPTEVIADALSDRVQMPIDRNDPPRLTKRIVGTLKSIRESPIEINQTLYANSKTGSVPKSKINRQLRSTGDETSARQYRLEKDRRKNYDKEVTIHNHPMSLSIPSAADLKGSIKGNREGLERRDYITGMYGFDVTKYNGNKNVKPRTLKKYNRDVIKMDNRISKVAASDLEKEYGSEVKRLKERNKKVFGSYEKYGI